MRRHAFLIPVLAVILACARAPAGEHPWTGKRIHYVTHFHGELREKGFFIRREGSYKKRPCVISEEEKFVFAGDPGNPVQAVKIRSLTTPDGEALQRHETVLIGQPGREIVDIADGEALFEASGVFGSSARTPVPDGLIFEISGEWLAKRNPGVGASHVVDVLDRPNRRVVRVRVDILDLLSPAADGGPAVWLAEMSVEGRPSFQARFTSDGRLLRLDSGDMVYQVVGREDYELGRLPPSAPPRGGDSGFSADFSGERIAGDPAAGVRAGRRSGDVSIPVGETVPAWDAFAWLMLRAEPAHEWNNYLISSEYSQIRFNGVDAVISAVRNAPRIDAEAVFPMAAPAELQPFLAASEFVPATHPSIIDAAYAAVYDSDARRGESNIVRAVSFLAGWINQAVGPGDWRGYDSSALDALASRSGDSLAQARLFSAMARTLGVPTRLCQGFLVRADRATLHFWSEAWVNGSWIPVDTTVGRVGLPAGYVLAERTGGEGGFTFDFASFLSEPDRRLRLLTAGRDTPGGGMAELVVGDRHTYAYSEGDWLANLYWGFALRLPASWRGRARLDSVEMTSPDGQASVKCEALPGEFRAGEEELRSNIASLRSALSRFRLIDDRVVSFDPDGATPALFMDFTCVQDGVSLRCRQYVVPRRQRAFRISFWAPADKFTAYVPDFDSIVASLEF